MSTISKQKTNLNRARQEIAEKYKRQIQDRDNQISILTAENKTLQDENAELKAKLATLQKAAAMTDTELEQFRQDLKRIDNMDQLTARFEKFFGPLAQIAGAYN